METVQFLGLECTVLENERLSLLVTRSAGPRILALRLRGGENLFAELPGVTIDWPGLRPFRFYGGHRLWHAPELPERTYVPDDGPVEVTSLEAGLSVTQPTELETGLQKSLEIQIAEEAARVVVTHRLANRGLWPVRCAPWAITQMKTGGVAILPQARHDSGVLPNRSLALWPYTDMSDPNVSWGRDYILLRSSLGSPFKVGFPNPRGWLAYWRNGVLFVKRAAYEAEAEYFDHGSSSECYADHRFLELETLAPVTTLAPGESAAHTETWGLYEEIEAPRDESAARTLAERLGLG